MSDWFQAKVKFLRQMDNGLIKSITEQYLVDSMSFTETEARVMQEVGEGTREVQAVAISRSNIKEVVMYGDTDMFFKVKVQYSITDEETEKEKKVTTYLLVNANDPKEAYERAEEHLKEMLVPFRITKVEESPICEVYEHKSNERVGNHNSAGAYYDEELTEDQKNILKERACDAPKMDDVALFKGTPIMSLSEKERGFVRALLAHFCEFYSRPIKETTIDCPMEGDIEHLSTWQDPQMWTS